MCHFLSKKILLCITTITLLTFPFCRVTSHWLSDRNTKISVINSNFLRNKLVTDFFSYGGGGTHKIIWITAKFWRQLKQIIIISSNDVTIQNWSSSPLWRQWLCTRNLSGVWPLAKMHSIWKEAFACLDPSKVSWFKLLFKYHCLFRSVFLFLL